MPFLPDVRLAPLLALAVAAVTACSTSETPGDTGAGGGGGSAPSICASDPRVTPYKNGLSAETTDGAMTVAFVSSDPGPPVRGDNAFTLKVTDKAGKAVSGLVIDTLSYMPDHGHVSPTTPGEEPGGAPGEYAISPVYLFMPGVWEITFKLTHAADESDVKFTFCIDG